MKNTIATARITATALSYAVGMREQHLRGRYWSTT
jgi:hypothetical protein